MGKENIKPTVNREDGTVSVVKPKTVVAQDDADGCGGDDVFSILYKDPEAMAYNGRTIYLTRHGESVFNLYGRIGGNAGLSSRGLKYAKRLAKYMDENVPSDLEVWTSELTRTNQTALHLDAAKKTVVPQLNEINAGEFDGMMYEAIAEKFPVEFAMRDQDKLRYRYPSGESYVDVCRRLLDVLPLMNRSQGLLVISHQAVLRCVYAYLMKEPMDKVPYVVIPLHTVLKVTFNGTKNVVNCTFLNVACVDTHRAKPDNCGKERGHEDAIITVPKHL